MGPYSPQAEDFVERLFRYVPCTGPTELRRRREISINSACTLIVL